MNQQCHAGRSAGKSSATPAVMAGVYRTICTIALAWAASQAAYGQAGAAAADGGATLAEVVVTAQRRAESAQRVPISLTAITAEALAAQNVVDTRDALRLAPNVNLSASRGVEGDMRITIRGIGTVVNNIDEPVAVYMDDVYLANAGMFNMSVADLERVEVLRGPQGTLYGRNSMAGAVNFITREPQNFAEGSIDASYGNLNYTATRLMGNVPLVADRLLLRANFAYTRRDGFAKDITNGAATGNVNNIGGRIQLEALVSDELTLKLEADYARDDILPSAISPVALAINRQTNLFDPFRENRHNYGGGLHVTYRTERFDVVSITGVRYLHDAYVGSDFVAVDAAQQLARTDDHQVSQELRLVSADSKPLKWVVGAFYLDESRQVTEWYQFHEALSDLFGGGLTGYRITNPSLLKTHAWAGFGDVTYSFNDRMDLSLGLRYGQEHKVLHYDAFENFSVGFTPFGYVQSFTVPGDYRSVLPKGTFTYHLGDSALVYATVAKGGKSGGFDSEFLSRPVDSAGMPIVGTPTPAQLFDNYGYRPEHLWNYETGFKSSLWDRRVTLNGALFYMDWREQQVTISNGIVARTGQVRKARSYGAELEANARPIPNVELNVGLAYNRGTFVEAPNIVQPVTLEVTDISGNRQPNDPVFSATVGAQYTFNLTGKLRMPLRADFSFWTKQYFQIFNTPALSQEGYGLLNLRVGLETDPWGVYLFANNVTDRHYLASGQQCLTTCSYFPPFETNLASIGEPRLYGINAHVKF